MPIMIKAPERPSIRRVALLAGLPEGVLVMGILMASRATHRRAAVLGTSVAFFAGDGGMETDQREPVQFVVETHLLMPPRFVVAVFAFGPELTLMRILGLVARDT